jgi:hypothetical protein
MNELDTAIEHHIGEKRAAALNDEGEQPHAQPQSPTSPPKKKKVKLDSAAQSLLTEIFALQDTLSENEIEALARKVRGMSLL